MIIFVIFTNRYTETANNGLLSCPLIYYHFILACVWAALSRKWAALIKKNTYLLLVSYEL